MKLLLVFVLLSAAIFTSMAATENDTIPTQEAIYVNELTSDQYVTNSNVEKLVDKYSKKIEASVTALAQQLKQPAEHIYKVLVKQQVVCGYAWLGLTLFGLIGVIIGSILLFKSNNDNRYNESLENLSITILIITSAGFLIGFIGFFSVGLAGLLNPEYGAITEIMDWFK